MQFIPKTQSAEDFSQEKPEIIPFLGDLKAEQSLKMVAGLALNPNLQSNAYRIEMMVHLVLSYCHGKKSCKKKDVAHLFSLFEDTYAASQEDPAEDLFVHSICTLEGNFFCLQGIWEGNSFYLSRVLGILEGIEGPGELQDLRSQAYSLLRVSDFMCRKAKLEKYEPNLNSPVALIDKEYELAVPKYGACTELSARELREIDLSFDELVSFEFPFDNRIGLKADSIDNSDLNRRPLVFVKDKLIVALPNSIGVAIIYFVINKFHEFGLINEFRRMLSDEYASLLSRLDLLGERRTPEVVFKNVDDYSISTLEHQIDPGRFLNFAFFIDDLSGFGETGLAGMYEQSSVEFEQIEARLNELVSRQMSQNGYVQSICFLVFCGVGRGLILEAPQVTAKSAEVEYISAYDCFVLSSIEKVDSYYLIGVIEQHNLLHRLGVRIANMGGLLNLVASALSNGGRLVDTQPNIEERVNGPQIDAILVGNNFVFNARRESSEFLGLRMERYIDGLPHIMFKSNDSVFEEDRAPTVYIAFLNYSFVRLACIRQDRKWWVNVYFSSQESVRGKAERTSLFRTWARKIVRVLDKAVQQLPENIVWHIAFEVPFQETRNNETANYAEVSEELAKNLEIREGQVFLLVPRSFDVGMNNPTNISESALVYTLVTATLKLTNQRWSDKKIHDFVGNIVSNKFARHLHAVAMPTLRQLIRHKVPITPIFNDNDAMFYAATIGIGWKDKRRTFTVSGRRKCTSFLNAAVERLIEDLCRDLAPFDKLKTLTKLLVNHELVAAEGERWIGTQSAIIALHDDQEETKKTLSKEISKNTLTQISSRIVMEIAICECHAGADREPGIVDVMRWMAKATLLLELGEWSDAIHKGFMKAEVHITGIGEIYVDQSFIDEIMEPYFYSIRSREADKSYEKYMGDFERERSFEEMEFFKNDPFNEVLLEEFSLNEEQLFTAFRELYQYALDQKLAVFHCRRSGLIRILKGQHEIDEMMLGKALDRFTLRARVGWKVPPDGFRIEDIMPWRFRRALSFVRRPILEIVSEEDPILIVAPGALTKSLAHVVHNLKEGDFPDYQLGPIALNWKKKMDGDRGLQFNEEVASKLRELGWSTEANVLVRKILKKRTSVDFGDIDVLASSRDGGQMLIVECKNIRYRKTAGEVAEQLSRFRGETSVDGRRDELKKHLDRVAILSEHSRDLAEYLSVDDGAIIRSILIFPATAPMEYMESIKNTGTEVFISGELEKL